MKQWLNNWEKIIGDRLRGGKSRPGSHVWDLIEQGLDAQMTERRTGAFRIVAVVALLLLLMTTAFWMTTPSADLAQDRNFSILFDQLQENNGQWTMIDNTSGINSDHAGHSGNEFNAQRISGNVVESVVAESVRISSEQESDEVISSINSSTVAIVAEPVSFVESSMVDVLDNVSDERLVNFIQDQVLLDADAASKADLSMESKLQYHELNVVETELRPRGQELLNRIAAHASVGSQLLVRYDQPSLNAYQNISQLAIHPGNVEYGADIVGPSGLSMDNELLVMASVAQTSGQVEQIIGEMKVVEQAEWITEALTELESWKTSVDAQVEDEAASGKLEELIEEAVIDEEDPLTQRQNATKDLYRAHNINKGFHIGMISGFQGTWVTRASRNPEVNRSYVDYKFNAGYQVGLNMGYDFTEHFGLMMEFKYSNEGGRYFHPMRQREQQIDLRYVEVPLFAKVKHSKLSEKMRPLVFNYLVGITYSDLRKINVSDGGVDKRFGQDYNTTEWGLSAGFDFDVYINKNFFWTLGSRVGVSGNAKNFPRFKGEDGDGAMSIDAGLYTRLNFRLPGK